MSLVDSLCRPPDIGNWRWPVVPGGCQTTALEAADALGVPLTEMLSDPVFRPPR